MSATRDLRHELDREMERRLSEADKAKLRRDRKMIMIIFCYLIYYSLITEGGFYIVTSIKYKSFVRSTPSFSYKKIMQ